jgi:hypothetical protein
MNKRTTGLVVGVVLALGVLGGGAVAMMNRPAAKTGTVAQASVTPAATPTPKSTGLTYQGVDGKTALELLKAKDPKVVTKGEGANAYVTTVNGYTASDTKKEYWSFLVNGKMSEVGAGSYITKSTDQIEWKIATY